MPRKKPAPKQIQIDSIADESRANIPTNERRDFVADDEHNPQMKLYPRNPDLDPQLVWKGKDEQDNQDLKIPILPIYTQEKIHPLAIIQDILDSAKKVRPGTIDLFGNNINDLEFEQLIKFDQQEGLKGKVQMIYIDPPYGIKFDSNWIVRTRKRDVKDGKADIRASNPTKYLEHLPYLLCLSYNTWDNASHHNYSEKMTHYQKQMTCLHHFCFLP